MQALHSSFNLKENKHFSYAIFLREIIATTDSWSSLQELEKTNFKEKKLMLVLECVNWEAFSKKEFQKMQKFQAVDFW